MHTDHLSLFRAALGPGALRRQRRQSPLMIERASWAELRRVRRLIVETKRMLGQTYFASAWHVLEDQLADYRSERDHVVSEIRRARYAAQKLGGM